MSTRHLISFDWAIKNQLRNKANFEILEGFLTELTGRDIKINYIGESEGQKNSKDDKTNRVDIFVEADKKELIIVELQYDSEYDYFQRMLYGASKSILEHITKGDDYSNVRKVYSVNIVHFDLGTGEDYLYHGTTTFKGLHTKKELILSEKQKKVYLKDSIPEIFPEYYIIKVRKFKEPQKDADGNQPPPLEPLDQWVYYFKTSKIMEYFNAKGMDKAREALAFENLDDRQRREYWEEVEGRRVRNSELHTKYAEGKVDGEEIAEKKIAEAENKVQQAEKEAQTAKKEAQTAKKEAQQAKEEAQQAENKAQQAESELKKLKDAIEAAGIEVEKLKKK